MKTRARALLVLSIALAGGFATLRAEEAETRQPYRFVVRSDRGTIRGLIRVDGVTRLVDGERSPFEFECEEAAVISGYFEPIAGAKLSLAVFDPKYKRGRSKSLSIWGADKFRFTWGQPGVSPRCADVDDNQCPATVPSGEEFRAELERLLAEAEQARAE